MRNTTWHVLDDMSTPSQWLVANKSVTNLERGVLTRVFFVKGPQGNYIPCPRPTLENANLLSGFRRQLVKRFAPAPIIPLDKIPEMYVGRKRVVYQRAVDSLRHKPLNYRDAEIAAHTKVEKINIAMGYQSLSRGFIQLTEKDPRVIQARTPRYNAVLAKYLKSNEHRIFQAIDRVFSAFNGDSHGVGDAPVPTVMKGLNADQQGAAIASVWHGFDEPVGIRLDASRFDQHCSSLVLKFEHSCYLQALQPILSSTEYAELSQLLRWQLDNKCYGRCPDGLIKYTAGGRMSGDMNTGLGNVVIMCAMMYSFFEKIRRDIELVYPGEEPARLALINNGDDCCLVLERRFLQFATEPLAAYFLAFGFEMTTEGFAHELEQIKFCQSHPIWMPTGYRMVRSMPMSFAKDSINLGVVTNQAEYDAWRGAISGCGLALTRGVPMAQAYYESLGLGTERRRTTVYTTGMEFLAHGMETGTAAIHPRTRVSVALAFGIPPDLQVAIEKHYYALDCRTYQPTLSPNDHGVCGVEQPAWV